jgi:hypothetical protein
MQYTKLCSIFLLLLVVNGCTHASYTRKLDTPIERKAPKGRLTSSLDVLNSGERSASIGDPLFRVSRYQIGEYGAVRLKALTAEPFPQKASWLGTYVYNDQTSGDLIVFTTPAYYKGQIGVILDEQGRVATEAPLIQVDGGLKGRRWKVNGSGQFFDESKVLVDRWEIRYGGKAGDQYIFEIVNKAESSTSDILQSIKISESSFFEGFTVRDVFIKGLSGDSKGVIRYSVIDTLADNK